MDRVSSGQATSNMQFYLRERQKELQQVQRQISSQSRIQNLRDDPLAASHATRYRSYTARLERFSENIQTIRERNEIAEGYLMQATELLQRVRELTVQGANGTYAAEDLKHIAVEVDQVLAQMVEIGNARGSDGTTIFAGDRSQLLPFRTLQGIEGDGVTQISEVQYRGTINRQRVEIGENSTVETNFVGSEVFWAESQQIQSRTDARGYLAATDSTFSIDGREIEVRAGENAYSIINKINESGVPVRASIDPVYSSVVIEGTTPHQVWLQDHPGSSVLADLGIVDPAQPQPPHNIATSAQVSGGSVFDALIRVREQLERGDQEALGGRGLRQIDRALDNMFTGLSGIGAVNARLDSSFLRTENEIPKVVAQDSRNTDIDLAEAMLHLKELENAHKAALGASARIMQPTLLDFIR